jgi:hypothetical protein
LAGARRLPGTLNAPANPDEIVKTLKSEGWSASVIWRLRDPDTARGGGLPRWVQTWMKMVINGRMILALER